eukprot:893202-Amphidinium_carterae.1
MSLQGRQGFCLELGGIAGSGLAAQSHFAHLPSAPHSGSHFDILYLMSFYLLRPLKEYDGKPCFVHTVGEVLYVVSRLFCSIAQGVRLELHSRAPKVCVSTSWLALWLGLQLAAHCHNERARQRPATLRL